MSKWAVLLVAACFVAGSIAQDVLDLTDNDFSTRVAESDTTLVMFYAPWYVHLTSLYRWWWPWPQACYSMHANCVCGSCDCCCCCWVYSKATRPRPPSGIATRSHPRKQLTPPIWKPVCRSLLLQTPFSYQFLSTCHYLIISI